MKGPDYILQSLLKGLLIFNVRIWYGNNTINKNVQDALVIKCINFDKTIGCALDTLLSQLLCFRMLVYLGTLIKKTEVRF